MRGPDPHHDLGEDRVDRVGDRLPQGHRAGRHVGEVVHHPAPVGVQAAPTGNRQRCGPAPHGAQRDAALDRGSEREDLERAAGLAARLAGEIEASPPMAGVKSRHRADCSGARVDRYQCSGWVRAAAKPAGGRPVGDALQAWVERRLDAQPAVPRPPGAVAADQLAQGEVEERREANPLLAVARPQAQRSARGPAKEGLGDLVVATHCREDLVAARERRLGAPERVVVRGRLR
jgi:hypothetical protein